MIEYFNNIALIEGDTHISMWVKEHKRLDHDQSVLPLVLKHISKESIVFDIGAYIGDHTIAYASTGAKVYAFEPNEEAFKCLRHNMGGTDTICRRIAFSDSFERMKMVKPNNNHGMTYFENTDSNSYDVVSNTIDNFCETYEIAPTFIKIDAEGMEKKILYGGLKTIRSHKPTLFLEVNNPALARNGSNATDLIHFIEKDLGYHVEDIYKKDLSLLKQSIQFDIICVPK